ncbi:MAG: ribosome maturation factor RimM [Nannocystaceae bacterium]
MASEPVERPGEPPLELGVVIGAHGIAGVLRILLHAPDSDALQPGRTVALVRDGARVTELTVEAVAPVPGKPNRRRLTAAGLRDRDEAEALRGCELWMSRDELPPLADDEYYLADAIGLAVQRERDGAVQALGKVTGLTSNGVQDLFEVSWRGPDGRARPWLLPVLPHTIVDIDGQRILVDVPLGMLPDGLEDPAEGAP